MHIMAGLYGEGAICSVLLRVYVPCRITPLSGRSRRGCGWGYADLRLR